MKSEAYLINTSRGPIVVEADLIAALRAGRIAGAGIDVLAVSRLARDIAEVRSDGDVIQRPERVSSRLRPIIHTDTLEALVAFADGAPIRVANPDALIHTKQRRQ